VLAGNGSYFMHIDRQLLRLPILLALSLAALPSCGGTDDGATDTAVVDTADTADDAATDIVAEVTVPTQLKWTAAPGIGQAARSGLNAVTPIPGSKGQYLVVGDSAQFLRYDGTALVDEPPPPGIAATDLTAVWVAPEGDVFLAGKGSALWMRNADGWTLVGEIPPSPVVDFTAISGTSRSTPWAVGERAQAWEFDGEYWEPRAVTPTDATQQLTDDAAFTCVHVRGKGDVWIGAGPTTTGGGLVLHGGGSDGKWQAWATDATPRGLWVSEPVAKLGGKPKVFVAAGSLTAYLAVMEDQTKGFVKQNALWSLGFSGVAGVGADQVWAIALKGQLRRWGAVTCPTGQTPPCLSWSTESIKSPVGTKESEAIETPTADFVSLAIHDAEERVLLTASRLYRWGHQPK
jgi:hypothetical protein